MISYKDKLIHFGICAVSTVLLYLLGVYFTSPVEEIIAVLGIGLAKEVGDFMGSRIIDPYDILADVIGIMFGVIIIYVLNLWIL